MTSVIADTIKAGEYHKARITIERVSPYLLKTIISDEMFTSKLIALKHAQAWRNEALIKWSK